MHNNEAVVHIVVVGDDVHRLVVRERLPSQRNRGAARKGARIGSTSSRLVPGLRGRFQHHELALAQEPGHALHRRDDEGHVWFEMLRQGRGDANQDGIRLREGGEIGGLLETLAGERIEALRGDMLDVAAAIGQGVDLGRLDVDANYREAAGVKAENQGQAHIAEPDHGNRGLPRVNAAHEISCGAAERCCRHAIDLLNAHAPLKSAKATATRVLRCKRRWARNSAAPIWAL
jgi:hypothetical protein